MTNRTPRNIENFIWYVRHTKFGTRYATGQLWHALYRPRRSHPVLLWAKRTNPGFKLTRIQLLVLLATVIIPLAFYGSLVSDYTFPSLVVLLSAAIPALALLFNGTVLGTHWAMTIGEAIAREYQGGRFELLTITPDGTLEISWLLAMGVLHRTNRLQQVFNFVRTLIGVLLFGMLFMLLMNSVSLIGMNESERFNQFSAIHPAIIGIFVFSGLFLDHIQSIVIAVLVGVWIPSYVQSPQLARNLAVGVYLTLQISFYAAVVGFYVALQNGLPGIVTSYWLAEFILVAATFAMYVLLREGLIRVIWWGLSLRYQSSLRQFREMIA